MSPGDARPPLPCPGVRLPPGFPTRLERVALRLAAHRERTEGRGRAALSGGGETFVGHRPYRPGEDLRRLDWDVLARLDRPFVRVQRRESSERWAIALDVSGSMGVGPPGKLQAAAELVAGLCAVALREHARVRVLVEGRRPLELTRRTDLGSLLRFLEGLRAGEGGGLGRLLERVRMPSDAGRVVLVGDLLDLGPSVVRDLHRPGRELLLAQVLAPLELEPPEVDAVRWLDPEGDGLRDRTLDAGARSAYARALERELEGWAAVAARHGCTWRVRSSSLAFEDWLPLLLLGEGR